jgi:hypothetical protein
MLDERWGELKLTPATLALGGSGGGCDLAEVDDDLSHPKGPRRVVAGGGAAEALTGGVDTPDEPEDAEPRFRRGSSGGPRGTGVIAAVELLPSGVVSESSEDCRVGSTDPSRGMSIKVSSFSRESCMGRPLFDIGDTSRLMFRFDSSFTDSLAESSTRSDGSECGVTVLDLASTKSSTSCAHRQHSTSQCWGKSSHLARRIPARRPTWPVSVCVRQTRVIRDHNFLTYQRIPQHLIVSCFTNGQHVGRLGEKSCG